MGVHFAGDTTGKIRILLIESDEESALAQITALEEAGYSVIKSNSFLEGIKKLYEKRPDLVILAHELAMKDVEDPFMRIRRAYYIPVIVIGSRENATETLERGADAYMVKPPSLPELVARVGSLLRRKKRHNPLKYNSQLDDGNRPSTEENGLNGLTRTEFRLATCLMFNEGSLVDNQRLIREVWGGERVSLATLHYFVRSLRKKVTAGSIYNIRGLGYWFTGQMDSSY